MYSLKYYNAFRYIFFRKAKHSELALQDHVIKDKSVLSRTLASTIYRPHRSQGSAAPLRGRAATEDGMWSSLRTVDGRPDHREERRRPRLHVLAWVSNLCMGHARKLVDQTRACRWVRPRIKQGTIADCS